IMDRNWIGHTITLHEELVHVPLVVRLPKALAASRRGVTVAEPVSLIDLPATIFDLATSQDPVRAGVDLGHSRSLAPTILAATAPERRWLYLHVDSQPPLGESKEERTVLQWGLLDGRRRLKWIVDHKVPEGELPRPHLYDLARDPREQTDL